MKKKFAIDLYGFIELPKELYDRGFDLTRTQSLKLVRLNDSQFEVTVEEETH